MSEIRYRIAKPSDAKAIANLQWHVRERYEIGISLALGKRFLEAYYKVVLNDPWEVVVCAVNEKDEMVGFASTSMNAKERFSNIKNHRLALGWAALLSVIRHPSLLKAIWLRYKSLGNSKDAPKFVNTEGVRGGYWCWLKSDDSLKSFEMSTIKNNILKELGVKELFFEVDKFNKAVYKFHLKVNKAEPIEEITLPDGRERVLMKKKL